MNGYCPSEGELCFKIIYAKLYGYKKFAATLSNYHVSYELNFKSS